MPPFSVNPARRDPYKAFKFRVLWDGRAVAGVRRVSALRRVSDVVSHRDGGEAGLRRSPGITRFDPVTLERGLTHDAAFEAWANKVHAPDAPTGAEVSLKDFRKDVRIELMNEAGQVVLAYMLHRCWPSAYTALPDLDAGAPGPAFERLVLECEGWARDEAVTEPDEPARD